MEDDTLNSTLEANSAQDAHELSLVFAIFEKTYCITSRNGQGEKAGQADLEE